MELIIGILAFILGTAFGAFLATRLMVFNISQNPQKIIAILKEIDQINKQDESKEEPLDDTVDIFDNISTEEHNGVTYLFDKDTREFIAQGPNFDTALEAAEKRFPGRFTSKIATLEHQST